MNEIYVLILGVRQQAIPDSMPSPHFPITYQAMPTSILKQTNNRNPKGTVPLGLAYKFILDDHSALEKKIQNSDSTRTGSTLILTYVFHI